ncbi:phosphatase PAP2 family protein [Jatrophihabitans sp.]|uniref:phosphatase PAP2 family protein n=1 Tax=Jatrophihabitans sp. TaxID=1932789 RepID=UPI0030C78443|nr:hypothetical protein [Jatrophihabitans sp.]
MAATQMQWGTDSAAELGGRRRFTGLLPNRLLRWRRPVWWQELFIIALGYWLYSLSRNAIKSQRQVATAHGHSVEKLQNWLHLNFEQSVNQWVGHHEWVAQTMDYYYATLHFIVTIGVMLWLFIKRPHLYRGARTALFVTTLIALAGFEFYPLSPPRLLAPHRYVDTLLKFHTWGSLADPKVAEHSNQYAAMPSLHIGWALWCAITVFMCARRLWVRLLGLLYPVGTLIVIIGTANHYLLDAVAGAMVFGAAVGLEYGLRWTQATWRAGRASRREAPVPA